MTLQLCCLIESVLCFRIFRGVPRILLDVGCHLQSVNNEMPSLIQDKSMDVSYALSSNQILAPAYFLDRAYQKHVCFHFDGSIFIFSAFILSTNM